jgi:hypothetical protein
VHFRIRQHVVQLIRTSYDPATKKPKATVLGRMPLRNPALTPELRAALTPAEIKEAEAWLQRRGRLELLREEFAALGLPEELLRAANWFRTNADSPAAQAAAADLLPALYQLRQAIKELGVV